MVNRMDGGGAVQQTGITLEKGAPEMDMAAILGRAIVEKVPPSETEQQLPLEKAKRMTDSLNKFMESSNTELRFKLHDELKEYYVTIIDSKTDEVVREIPSKKLMDIHAAMREFVGLLVDRKI